MFVAHATFLLIFQLVYAEDPTEKTVLSERIYDDVTLKEILNHLDQLLATNEVLRLKIDSQNLIIDQQFEKQQNELKWVIDQQFTNHLNKFEKNMYQLHDEFKKHMDQQFAKQQDEFKKHVDQLQDEFKKDIGPERNEFKNELNQQFTKHQDNFKKDLDQQFINQQNVFKKDMDQELNEFKREISQQFSQQQNKFKKVMDRLLTKERNEFKKDFEDLKLALTASGEPLLTAESKDANLTNIPLCTDFINQHQKINQSKPISTTRTLPANCIEALENTGQSGIYKIKLPKSELEPFNVYCISHVGSDLENNTQDVNSSNAAWMIVQRRQDGSVDFYRNWTEYQNGFGDLKGEFFIGLDKLHELTQSTMHELWIQLEDFEGSKRWAKYSSFSIGGENESYILNDLGTYAGDAGDALSYHVGYKWTTKDVNNNNIKGQANCASKYKGAWWYKWCHLSNLNGQYYRGTLPEDEIGEGVIWQPWRGQSYSLKYVHMAIRPVQWEGLQQYLK